MALTENDCVALNLAIEHASRDPERKEQITSMLDDRSWAEVGMFAAYSAQCDALHLEPWQPAPMDIEDPDVELAAPSVRDDGRTKAARLLKQMLEAGISRYHPDPPAALKAAKRKA